MQRVRVRHPGYNHPNILFMFPASDGAHRDHAHYATIWMACSIFIDNRQDHWLSSSTSGEPRLSADADGLMHAVPNFRAWRYPHSSLSPLWTEASQNDEVGARHTGFSTESIAVERCRITNRKLEVDNAHIIPISEKLWFTNNEMGVYGDLYGRSGEIIADSFANLLRLRCDAHRLWDKLNFSIVPRYDHTAENRAAWFTQALGNDEELHQYWHRQKLDSLAGRPPQYLLARFAWDIFPKLHEFLQAGQERQLTVWTLDGTAETRRYSGPECRKFTIGQGQNRSASPTKRARSQSSNYPNDLVEAQYEEGSQKSNVDSLASDYFAGSDGADSAVGGMQRSYTERRLDGKTEAEQERHRYLYGHVYVDERRGRKRHRI
ncbi:hypothetical protein BST61_g9167 [Cercospora zeina]